MTGNCFLALSLRFSAFRSVLTGSLAETLAELADEIAVVVKSSGVGNLGDRTGGADEQGAGFIKAGFQDVLTG